MVPAWQLLNKLLAPALRQVKADISHVSAGPAWQVLLTNT